MNKVFENEEMTVYVKGNAVHVENKKSQVWGIVRVDGPCVIFTSRSLMELVNIMGNACVSCWDRHDDSN